MDPNQFHFFSRLPTELRLAIWRECLPNRVAEIDQAFDEGIYLHDIPTPCNLWKTSAINRHPPLISRVCRESRLVATEAGHYRDEKSPPDVAWNCRIKLKKSWIDPSRDSIHLNWIPWCEPEFWHKGSALDHLAWHAAKAQGGSFMFGYLENNWDNDVNMKDRVGAVQKLQHGTIVMRVIVAHTTFQNVARSGLFGPFGDAPVQLVGVSDEQRLDAFFAFAEKCESHAQGFLTKGQRFHRESPESIKTIVRERLAETFGAQAAQTLPPIHPAIMFRFCPCWCNHSQKLSTNPRYPQDWR